MKKVATNFQNKKGEIKMENRKIELKKVLWKYMILEK